MAFFQLKEQTPYMVRRGGVLLTCGDVHPYILYNSNGQFRINLSDFVNNPQWLDWFVENSEQDLNYLIKDCLQSVADIFVSDSEIDIMWNFGIDKDFDFPMWEVIFNKYGIKPKKLSFSIGDNYYKTCEAMWQELNYKYNQEFLRMRTSSAYRYGGGHGVFFRISSFEYNWFTDIWNICAKYKNWVSDVTIVADPQSGKNIGRDYYIIDGIEMNSVPINDFLLLSGRPVIESVDSVKMKLLHDGYLLNEALGDFGSFHNVRGYNAYMKFYIKENFSHHNMTQAQLRMRECLMRELLLKNNRLGKHSLSVHELLNKLTLGGDYIKTSDCAYVVLLNDYGRNNLLRALKRSYLFTELKNDEICVEYKYEDQYLLEVFDDRLVIVEFGG